MSSTVGSVCNILEARLKEQGYQGYTGLVAASRMSGVKTMQWLLKLLVECDASLLPTSHWPQTVLWPIGPDANGRGWVYSSYREKRLRDII